MLTMRDLRGGRLRRIVLFGAGAAVLVTVSGVAGASFIKSPAEVAAETGPPPSSVITAPIVRKVLRESIVLRGVFSAGKALSFAPSSVAATEENAGGSGLVITGMYAHAGGSVNSGSVVAEVSDRPVYVLQGPLPLWRDLVPGESGKDVAELQEALGSLGFFSAYANGHFGPATEAAVRAFYAYIGYAPPVTTVASSGAVTNSAASAHGQAGVMLARDVQVTPAASAAPSPSATHRVSHTASPTVSPVNSPTRSPSPGTSASRSPSQPSYEVIVPMSEAWFIPELPARVLSVGGQVGAAVSRSLMTITEGGLHLTGQLDPSQAPLIREGMKVTVSAEGTGYSGDGTVASVGEQVSASSGNGGAAYVPVGISPSGHWPASLNGQNVQITITTVTSGKPVLAVPVAAVSSDASGQSEIVVEESNGTKSTVVVRTGMSAGGYVAVTGPAAALAPGSRVVVGQ